MRNLNGTRDINLTFRLDKTEDIHGLFYADWAVDVEDKRSVTGYVFLLRGGAIT